MFIRLFFYSKQLKNNVLLQTFKHIKKRILLWLEEHKYKISKYIYIYMKLTFTNISQTFEHIKKKEDYLGLILKHLGTSAVMDMLLRLVTCIEAPSLKARVLTVSIRQNMCVKTALLICVVF